jgi:hypothetical protein
MASRARLLVELGKRKYKEQCAAINGLCTSARTVLADTANVTQPLCVDGAAGTGQLNPDAAAPCGSSMKKTSVVLVLL